MKRIVNKKALHNLAIQERLEAGIVLTGSEAKAIKSGRVDFAGGFVTVRPDGLFLTHIMIPPYQAQQHGSEVLPTRDRKLLVHAQELARLIGVQKSRGLTIVPVSFYTKGGLVKVELGIGRGKRKADKRETIKKREVDRQMQRRLRGK